MDGGRGRREAHGPALSPVRGGAGWRPGITGDGQRCPVPAGLRSTRRGENPNCVAVRGARVSAGPCLSSSRDGDAGYYFQDSNDTAGAGGPGGRLTGAWRRGVLRATGARATRPASWCGSRSKGRRRPTGRHEPPARGFCCVGSAWGVRGPPPWNGVWGASPRRLAGRCRGKRRVCGTEHAAGGGTPAVAAARTPCARLEVSARRTRKTRTHAPHARDAGGAGWRGVIRGARPTGREAKRFSGGNCQPPSRMVDRDGTPARTHPWLSGTPGFQAIVTTSAGTASGWRYCLIAPEEMAAA